MVAAEALDYDDFYVNVRGAPAWLLETSTTYNGPLKAREIIICGPGGTGKSRGILQVIAYMCEANPGMRVLLCRKTRESMTSSTLVEWEECFPAGHEILKGAQREQRSLYHFSNGTEVAVIGLDKPTKIFSTKWDLVYVEELNEEGITKSMWELFYRGLRGNSPFNNQRFLIGSCNPSYPDHWVKQRLDLGLCETHKTRHEDNPRWHDGSKIGDEYDPRGWTRDGEVYLDSLRRMSGHNRTRLLFGEWIAAEGLVWDCWDEKIHVVPAKTITTGALGARKVAVQPHGRGDQIEMSMVFGAVDWGSDAAGVFQVWGLDYSRRMWMLAEAYRSRGGIDWWADRCAEFYREFDLHSVVADPSRPDMIDYFNRRIALDRGDESLPEFCVKAKNKRTGDLGGIEAVRTMMAPSGSGPRLLFLKDSLRFGEDPRLVESGKRTSTIKEIPAYVWESRDDGKPARDKTDESCDDHGCDAMRYAVMYALDMFDDPPEKPRFANGSNALRPQWGGGKTYEEWMDSLGGDEVDYDD